MIEWDAGDTGRESVVVRSRIYSAMLVTVKAAVSRKAER